MVLYSGKLKSGINRDALHHNFAAGYGAKRHSRLQNQRTGGWVGKPSIYRELPLSQVTI